MDGTGHMRGEEDAAFGRFLIETIAGLYATEADPKAVDRAVYKGTGCGAWVRFDAKGIEVGTIVEGSDAEFSERIDLTGVEMSDEGAALLVERWRAAVRACEDFADEHCEEQP